MSHINNITGDVEITNAIGSIESIITTGDVTTVTAKAQVQSSNVVGKLGIKQVIEKDYEKLDNLPKINGVELVGDKTTEDLGIKIPEVDLSNHYTKQETNSLLDTKLDKFIVTYSINPQTMEIISISHYSEEIINAYNEGKQVIFKGTILGLNIPMNSYLGLIEGDTVRSFATFRFDLGAGMMNLLTTISVTTDSVYLEVTQLKEDTGKEIEDNIFTVNYSLNPQNMTMTYISHYSSEIINAFNEGKKVTFRGYVLGLNVYVNSELELVDGQYAFTYPLLKVDLGEGEKIYLFKIQISSNSTSVEMNEIGGESGEDNNIFIAEYILNFNPLGITTISATQQEIVDAYNEGKKVMFYGSVVGSNIKLISELNTVDNGLPYTYPFLRTDLGEGIYNYFFRIGVYREFGTIEAYAFVDTNRLKKTEESFNQSLANIANSRPTTGEVQAMVNYYIHEGFLARENRLLPENVEEGTILKYVDGKWTAVEDDTFIVDYQLNPQTMTITEISHYSADIIEAYNAGKTVNFRCYVLGLGVYVSSDLNLIDGTIAYTMPIIRGDLGQGMMNYLFRVGIRTGSTFVEVRVLQDIG